ncbi:MAG: acetolactate synthase small subunit [Burkholderiales bacterium]|nr:acetolactate synthase small subunit [Burkholderiales bacterium]
MQHTLVALVEDKPGVLNRVASLFRRRAFNIESLTVGHTEQPGVSRMTIVIDSNQTNAERVTANLYKLVNVIQIKDLADQPSVMRDLALIKVSAPPERRSEVMQLVEVYRARIVDVTNDSLIIEITGDVDKIDSFVQVLQPIGVLEMVRTGLVAMARGAALGQNGNGSGSGNGRVQ